jgi:hypothetical protein
MDDGMGESEVSKSAKPVSREETIVNAEADHAVKQKPEPETTVHVA